MPTDPGAMAAASYLHSAQETTAAGTSTMQRGFALSSVIAALVDGVVRAVPILASSRHVAETLVRYAWVGGLSSALYAALVAIGISWLDLNHDVATVIAFLLVVPLNFAMHRGFTFRSLGAVQTDLTRYALLQATGIVVSLMIMSLCVDLLGLPYAFGIAGSIVLVPLVSFLVMDRWVFARKAIERATLSTGINDASFINDASLE